MPKKFFWVIICLIGFGGLGWAQRGLKEIKIVSQGVLNGKAIYLAQPLYSKAAIAVNASGTVDVLVTIDEKGNVIDAVAKSGHLLLQVESVKAAMQSKFEPIILSGKSTQVTGIIQYNYISAFPSQQYKKPITLITDGILNDKAKVLPMPKFPPAQPRMAGSVIVQVKINVQTGKVVWATAVSGHSLLRLPAENAAREAIFEPMLKEFDTIYAQGVLIYKIEDFNGKIIENKNPSNILPVSDSSKAIINGKATNLEKPEYPEKARSSCAKGKVEVLTLLHSGKGEVIAAKAITGDELLFESAEKAVMKSKFSPSNINSDNDFYFFGKVVYNFDSLSRCLSAGVVNQKALSLPKPQFSNPTNTKHFRIKEEQIVAVQIVIDMDGNVTNANAIFGHALLRSACEYAARTAKFSPTFINGPRIWVSGLLIYKFKLDGTIETNIERGDKSVLGKPINLIKPPFPSCNCKFSGNQTVLIQAEVDGQGIVTKATAISGHAALRQMSEQSTRHSKFLPIYLKTKLIIAYNFAETDEQSTNLANIEIKSAEILK